MTAGRTPGEVTMSPADVYIGPAGSETHLGYIERAVTFRINDTVVRARSNQTGRTPIRVFEAGQEVRLELVMQQFASLQIQKAINSAQVGTGASSQEIGFGGKAGTVVPDVRLWLHDANEATTNKAQDVVIHKAVKVDGPLEIEYGSEREKLIALVFEGIVDDSKTAGARLGTIGANA